jgi:hypothetical protein
MRLKLALLVMLFVLLAAIIPTEAAETEVGIYTDRVQDTGVTACPYCGRPIRPGPVHQDAEGILLDALRQDLADSGREAILPWTNRRAWDFTFISPIRRES